MIVPTCEFKIDCTNETQLTNGIHHVVSHLFPGEYSMSIIKGGNTNLLYLMTPHNNNHKKLLIRIYGENTEILINRKNEETLSYELGELGFGPQIYATFANGRIEQFYDNATIYPLYKKLYFTQIAETLATMHCLQPTSLQNKQYPSLWLTITKWFDIASKKQYKSLNWSNIHQQIAIMKSYLPTKHGNNIENVNKIINFIASKNKQTLIENNCISQTAYFFMFESVLCHNDLIAENILYLPQQDEIKFIDFEYGAYNYRAFDFANHFCEYPVTGVSESIDYYKKFPDKMHIKQFIKVYVDYLCEQHKKVVNKDVVWLYNDIYGDGHESYDEFLDVCVEIVISFCASAHYFWGLWSILMAQYSNILHFDFMKYAHFRFHKGYQHSLSILPNYLKFVEQTYLNAKL